MSSLHCLCSASTNLLTPFPCLMSHTLVRLLWNDPGVQRTRISICKCNVSMRGSFLQQADAAWRHVKRGNEWEGRGGGREERQPQHMVSTWAAWRKKREEVYGMCEYKEEKEEGMGVGRCRLGGMWEGRADLHRTAASLVDQQTTANQCNSL